MSISVIRVENLDKKYLLRHQQSGRHFGYTSLRDILTEMIKAPWGGASRFRRGTSATHESNQEEFWALQAVSFEVKQGESIGIIGRNGAGKSTLLKILSRIVEPTRGRVHLRGRVASLLEVGTGFHPELTGRENIYLNGAILGMAKVEIKRKFDEIVEFAEVEKFLDTPVKHYSSGMYMRLAFAVAAHLEPEILVVDEVLAVGDSQFQKKCLGKIGEVTRQGRTVLFVSHNMGAITNLCGRGIVLRKGHVDFDGSASQAVQRYLGEGLVQAHGGTGEAPHVLFQRPSTDAERPFAITRIETHDLAGRPKPIVMSGDACVIRITYQASSRIASGALALQFSGYDGSKVMHIATDPDSGFRMSLETGTNVLECVMERLPFAGGEWTIGAGLWIARTDDCLCWTPDLCVLQVEPGDVNGCGFMVRSNRTLVVTPHQWRLL